MTIVMLKKYNILYIILLLLCFQHTMNAQTSGPKSPDFGKFTPITTAGLVNEFDGSLNYSIPVLSLPSGTKEVFNLALTYTSGKSPLQDASWVGFGWDLNPGVITRQVKGFPDDFNGEQTIIFYNDIMPVFAHSEFTTVNGEFASKDFGIAASYLNMSTFSNYAGYNDLYQYGAGGSINIYDSKNKENQNTDNKEKYSYRVGLKGSGSWSYDLRGNEGFTLTVAPVLSRERIDEKADKTNDNAKINLSGSILGFYSDGSYNIDFSNSSFSGINNWGKGYTALSLPEYSNTTTFNFLYKFQLGYLNGPSVETGLDFLSNIGEELRFNPITKKKAIGYYYTGDYYNESLYLLDYHNETKSGLSVQRNKYLPIPYNNADNYVVSGQNLNGQFRLNSKKMGLFRPNEQKNESTTYDTHVTTGYKAPNILLIGADLTVNTDSKEVSKVTEPAIENISFGGSINESNINNYERSMPYSKSYLKDISENYYFKFSGDKSNSTHYYTNISNDINIRNMFSPLESQLADDELKFSENINLESRINQNEPVSRSAFVNYKKGTDGSIIGFEITNTDGKRYVYDLPSYNKNEGNILYSVSKLSAQAGVSTNYPYTNDGKIVFIDEDNIERIYQSDGRTIREVIDEKDDNKDKFVSGRISEAKYAAAYHLTAIYSADYVDLGFTGGSQEDIGEYVVFRYKQKYSENNPYKWREPYKGLKYEQGKLSNISDDVGTVAYGEKEVYYLSSIESKTHIALFIRNSSSSSDFSYYLPFIGSSTYENSLNESLLNGSGSSRNDALGANEDEFAAISGLGGDKSLDRLEKIILCSKDISTLRLNKVISTTYLSYDYSLWPGMPNSQGNGGKLTLKSIVTENGNVREANLSPYQFSYTAAATLATGNNDVNTHITYTLNQSPSFSYLNIDKWGAYKDNIDLSSNVTNQIRNSNMILGNDYEKQTLNANYDPAAWNLKEIIQPNQSRTIVQYEPNDYSYVQDEAASAMFILDSYGINNDNNVEVRIKPNITIPQINSGGLVNSLAYSNYLQQVVKDSMLLFNFLYKIEENSNVFSTKNEYISGYTKLINSTYNSATDEIILTFQGDLPIKKCQEYYRNNLMGLIQDEQSSPFSILSISNQINYTPKLLYEYDLSHTAFKKAQNSNENHDYNEKCLSIHPSKSFVRLPLPKEIAKIGDGVRVKRIITQDDFEQIAETTGVSSFYGTEYIYCDSIIGSKKYSSGVATNEPYKSNEENSIKKYLEYNDGESTSNLSYHGFLGGEYKTKENDFTQYDGPLSEEILPGADVNYSRIIAKPIDMNSINGYSTKNAIVKEYYTVKEFPFNMQYNISNKAVSNNPIHSVNGTSYTRIYREAERPWGSSLSQYLPTTTKVTIDNNQMSQGYQFIINDMHGKQKSISSYTMSSPNDFNNWKLGTRTSYEYYQPGEAVPVFENINELATQNLNNPISFKYDWLGLNMFFHNESYEMSSSSNNYKGDGDISIAFQTPPIFYLTGSVGYNYNSTTYKYFVSNKVIELPTLLKKQINYVDGVENYIENVAFDARTGEPLIQRKNDSYTNEQINSDNNLYYTVNMKASQAYPELDQMSANQNIYLQSNTSTKYSHNNFTKIGNRINVSTRWAGGITYRGANKCDFTKYLNENDKIKVYSSSNPTQTEEYYVISVNCYDIQLTPIGGSSISGLVDIEVIKSSKANKLTDNFANILSFDPNTITNTALPSQILTIEEPNGTTPNYETIWADRYKVANQLNTLINSFAPAAVVLNPYNDIDLNTYNNWILRPSINEDICIENIKDMPFSYSLSNNVYVSMRYVEPSRVRGTLAQRNWDDLSFNTFIGDNNLMYQHPDYGNVIVYNLFIMINSNDGRNAIEQRFSTPIFKTLGGYTYSPSFYVKDNGEIELGHLKLGSRDNFYILHNNSLMTIQSAMNNYGNTKEKKEQIASLKNDFNEVYQHYNMSDKLEVFNFCNPAKKDLVASNSGSIISSNATEYSKSYLYERLKMGVLPPSDPNDVYQIDYLKPTLPVSQYQFYNTKNSPNNVQDYNTTPFLAAGKVSNFRFYNWVNTTQNKDLWQKQFQINTVSRQNEMSNAINEIEIPNAVSYDKYYGSFPSFSIVNATSNQAFYENFEAYYKTTRTDFTRKAHTGTFALRMNPNSSSTLTGYMSASDISDNANYLAEMWVKYQPNTIATYSTKEDAILAMKLSIPFNVKLRLNSGEVYSYPMAIKQQIGEWYLLSRTFNMPTMGSGVLSIELNTGGTASTDSLFIDDFRLLPYNASMTSYVYDYENNYQLRSILDDSHIPAKFIYNSKGELKGKSISTTHGEKLINESFQNIPKVQRSTAIYGVNFEQTSSGSGLIKNNADDNVQMDINTQQQNINTKMDSISVLKHQDTLIQNKKQVLINRMKNTLENELLKDKDKHIRKEPGDMLDKKLEELRTKSQKEYGKSDTINILNYQQPIINSNKNRDSINSPRK